jgi:hypothetical protein
MKPQPGYPEAQLVTNRSAVLLYGASESDRHTWAQDAAAAFADEGPLEELREPDEKAVVGALARSKGVIYVPDAAKIPWDFQRELARQLHEREERPKWVFGLSMSPDGAVTKGLLRDDLAYALARSQLDLGDSETRAAVKKRRAKVAKKR